MPDEGSNGSSVSENDSESNGESEAGSNDRDSDSGGSSVVMKALAAASQAVKKHQMMRAPSRVVWMVKVRGPTVRWRGQMLEAAMTHACGARVAKVPIQ